MIHQLQLLWCHCLECLSKDRGKYQHHWTPKQDQSLVTEVQKPIRHSLLRSSDWCIDVDWLCHHNCHLGRLVQSQYHLIHKSPNMPRQNLHILLHFVLNDKPIVSRSIRDHKNTSCVGLFKSSVCWSWNAVEQVNSTTITIFMASKNVHCLNWTCVLAWRIINTHHKCCITIHNS